MEERVHIEGEGAVAKEGCVLVGEISYKPGQVYLMLQSVKRFFIDVESPHNEGVPEEATNQLLMAML